MYTSYADFLAECEDFDEEEYPEPDDTNLEMGFDPYLGCYTEDC